jgi:lipoprotein Spr
MQNFFLVSVALGIFSGTTLTAKAQPAVNIEQVNADAVQKKSVKFIEGKDIKPLPAVVKETSTEAEPTSTIERFTTAQFKYAQLLDVEVESITNQQLYNAIEKWWGTRYRYGGATEKGIDCSAFTGTIIHQVYGLVLPRTARDQYAQCIKLEKEEMLQGDLVFFNTRGGISHVGIYLGNGYFTHASTSIGVTINNLSEAYWNKKFIRGGRLTAPETTE